MNEIINKVTPLTSGIIWFPAGQPRPTSGTYKAIDYLLNGLLTSSLSAIHNASSWVILSENFGRPLQVFIVTEFNPKEYESFLILLKKDLMEEQSVLVIDENNISDLLLRSSPKEIKSHLHFIK